MNTKKIIVITFFVLIFSCSSENVQRKLNSNESSHGDSHEDTSGHHANILMTKIDLDPTVSLFTPEFLDHKKVENLLPKLGKENKSTHDLEVYLVASRLSKKSYDSVISTAQKIADIEISKGVQNEVSDSVKLEAALSALQDKKYLQAEFFLEELVDSKNPEVKASALNAFGVLSLIDAKEPEAVSYFNRSLKEKIDYLPAKINLGFLSLKYGQIEKAKHLLENIDDSWFVDSGKIVLLRQIDKSKEASHLCQEILKKKPNYKLSLFNCGLLEMQNLKKKKQAFGLISKALKIKGGPNAWQQDGIELLRQLGKKER